MSFVRALSEGAVRQLNTAVIITLLSTILVASSSFAEPSDFILDDTTTLKVERLIQETFTRLLDFKISHLDRSTAESYVKELGFSSVEEAFLARPKIPFPIYHVRLDQLRTYSAHNVPKAEISELLIDTHSWIFPISITGNGISQVRSSVTVVAIGKTLRISKMESPDLAEKLTAARVEANIRHPDIGCSCVAIWIPALSRHFFGDMTTDIPMIKVLEDGPGTLKSGDLLSAEEIFQKLSREAQDSRYDAPRRPPSKQRSIHQ